jgi:hypothetical protein
MKITDILLYAWIAWIVIGVALIKFLEWKGVIRPHGFSRGLTRYRPKPKYPPWTGRFPLVVRFLRWLF